MNAIFNICNRLFILSMVLWINYKINNKKFNCLLTSEKKGFVHFEDQIFYTSSTVTQNYIFTVASLEKATEAYSKFVLPQTIDIMIKIKLEELTTFSAIEIEQKKSKNGAPFYYYKNILLTRSCSITHHGNYGVFSLLYAWTIINVKKCFNLTKN